MVQPVPEPGNRILIRAMRLNRDSVGNPMQPSFRRKPESRKSPGKERAGYEEFWIPAFAGTTGL